MYFFLGKNCIQEKSILKNLLLFPIFIFFLVKMSVFLGDFFYKVQLRNKNISNSDPWSYLSLKLGLCLCTKNELFMLTNQVNANR